MLFNIKWIVLAPYTSTELIYFTYTISLRKAIRGKYFNIQNGISIVIRKVGATWVETDYKPTWFIPNKLLFLRNYYNLLFNQQERVIHQTRGWSTYCIPPTHTAVVPFISGVPFSGDTWPGFHEELYFTFVIVIWFKLKGSISHMHGEPRHFSESMWRSHAILHI